MANSYLKKNQGTATNAKKFTYSVWLKRSKLGSVNRFYQGWESGNNRFYAYFNNTDTLFVYAVTGGSIQVNWESARKFRDTNGWYHIVFSADSTQANSADRLKIYVNGVEETEFTKNNNPTQNIDWGNQIAQTGATLTLSGTESYDSQLYDGYMSHAAYVDGSQLLPTSFGEFDSTSGMWKIITAPSVTWGNTGYHLKFENSANLGLDSSGNTNNFTVGGDLKQSISTPSNVIATINALDNTIIGGNNKATFTDAGTTVQTGNTPYTASTSSYGVTKGKWYAEFKYTAKGATDAAILGVVGKIFSANAAIGTVSESYSYYVNGNKYVASGSATSYGSTWTLNDIIGIALDVDNSKLYFSKNGTWQDSGDPTSGSTGTGAISIAAVDTVEAGAYFMAVGDFGNPTTTYATWKPNFGEGKFGQDAVASAGTSSSGDDSVWEYDCPANYYGLNTKNINTYG